MEKLISEIEKVIANAKTRQENNQLTEEMNIKEIKFALDCLVNNKVSEGRKV